MAWTREALIARVQARIDEFGGQAAVLESADIGRELDDAARIVLRAVPPSFLISVATRLTDPAFVLYRDGAPYSVLVPLPATFLRFLRVRLNHWARAVDRSIEVDSQEYIQQAYIYTRATANSPTAAIAPAMTGAGVIRVIECFPAPGNDAMVGYQEMQPADLGENPTIPVGAKIYANTTIPGNIPPLVPECLVLNSMAAEAAPDDLQDAITWMAASRCLTSLRVQEGARNTATHFKEALLALGVANG